MIGFVDYKNYIGCHMNFMIYDIMVIGEENSSVSNLIVQNIHTLSHISPSKHIYIQI